MNEWSEYYKYKYLIHSFIQGLPTEIDRLIQSPIQILTKLTELNSTMPTVDHISMQITIDIIDSSIKIDIIDSFINFIAFIPCLEKLTPDSPKYQKFVIIRFLLFCYNLFYNWKTF